MINSEVSAERKMAAGNDTGMEDITAAMASLVKDAGSFAAAEEVRSDSLVPETCAM